MVFRTHFSHFEVAHLKTRLAASFVLGILDRSICLGLFETGVSYSGYVSGVDGTFRKRGRNLVESFLKRMAEFTKLVELEREINKEKSKKEPVLDLSGKNLFGIF